MDFVGSSCVICEKKTRSYWGRGNGIAMCVDCEILYENIYNQHITQTFKELPVNFNGFKNARKSIENHRCDFFGTVYKLSDYRLTRVLTKKPNTKHTIARIDTFRNCDIPLEDFPKLLKKMNNSQIFTLDDFVTTPFYSIAGAKGVGVKSFVEIIDIFEMYGLFSSYWSAFFQLVAEKMYKYPHRELPYDKSIMDVLKESVMCDNKKSMLKLCV